MTTGTLRALFTIRPYNPVSVGIRLANPVSFVKMAPASHVIAVDGDYGIEANMLKGKVQRVPLEQAKHGLTVVSDRSFLVPDVEASMAFLRGEAERGAPYDYKGAFGLGLAPGRNWQSPEDWFCFELFAEAMRRGGRDVFRDNAHVTAYMLMSLLD